MTENNKASTATEGAPQPNDSKRKIYFALAAFVCVVAVFGVLRWGNLTGMGSGKVDKPKCSPNYTTCVLGCNQQTVTISQKSQSSVTPSAKKKWDQALLHAQTRCIPTCYQVECLGKTPIDAAKFVLLQERKRLKK